MSTPQITDPKEKMSAALGAFLFFIPHFTGKKTEFVTLYMRQNFALFLIGLVLTILKMILGGIAIISMILILIHLAVLGISLFLIYVAYNGEKFEISLLTKNVNLLISKVPALQEFFSPKN